MKSSFCSSPWFHIRIAADGGFLPCRWANRKLQSTHNIRDTSISEYMNSTEMMDMRMSLLDGKPPDICNACYYEDSNNKVSGRQRQLLKSAISIGNFDKSLCASPHYDLFNYSNAHDGHTNNLPVDLQIDLGSVCNSACIMCRPSYSTRLATDYEKLSKKEPELFDAPKSCHNWTDTVELVDKFTTELLATPNIKYIQFLGGETLYLRSFYDMCNRLIIGGVAKDIHMGTTTNCTVYSPELVNIIQNFKHVHVGLSVESFHDINDYVRWPSSISDIKENIFKFLEMREEMGMHLALRITPNIFTIYHLDTVFDFMIQHSISAESCNILYDPSCLRIELLPTELILTALGKINAVIHKHGLIPSTAIMVNRRRDDLVGDVIADVIFEYKNFLENCSPPTDVESERYKLVKFIKAFESLRHNKIIDYLPEYEEFLRSYGY